MSRPWCPGSGRAVPVPASESRYTPRQVRCADGAVVMNAREVIAEALDDGHGTPDEEMDAAYAVLVALDEAGYDVILRDGTHLITATDGDTEPAA